MSGYSCSVLKGRLFRTSTRGNVHRSAVGRLPVLCRCLSLPLYYPMTTAASGRMEEDVAGDFFLHTHCVLAPPTLLLPPEPPSDVKHEAASQQQLPGIEPVSQPLAALEVLERKGVQGSTHHAFEVLITDFSGKAWGTTISRKELEQHLEARGRIAGSLEQLHEWLYQSLREGTAQLKAAPEPHGVKRDGSTQAGSLGLCLEFMLQQSGSLNPIRVRLPPRGSIQQLSQTQAHAKCARMYENMLRVQQRAEHLQVVTQQATQLALQSLHEERAALLDWLTEVKKKYEGALARAYREDQQAVVRKMDGLAAEESQHVLVKRAEAAVQRMREQGLGGAGAGNGGGVGGQQRPGTGNVDAFRELLQELAAASSAGNLFGGGGASTSALTTPSRTLKPDSAVGASPMSLAPKFEPTMFSLGPEYAAGTQHMAGATQQMVSGTQQQYAMPPGASQAPPSQMSFSQAPVGSSQLPYSMMPDMINEGARGVKRGLTQLLSGVGYGSGYGSGNGSQGVMGGLGLGGEMGGGNMMSISLAQASRAVDSPSQQMAPPSEVQVPPSPMESQISGSLNGAGEGQQMGRGSGQAVGRHPVSRGRARASGRGGLRR